MGKFQLRIDGSTVMRDAFDVSIIKAVQCPCASGDTTSTWIMDFFLDVSFPKKYS